MNKLKLDEPLNQNERYLYACAIRLDALCNMLSSFLEFYAGKNGVAVTSNEDNIKTDVKTEDSDSVVSEAVIPVSDEVVEKPKRTRKK